MKRQTRERFLYTLAFFGDMSENIGTLFGFIPSAYKLMYGYEPMRFKRHNYRSSYLKSLKRGLVKREKINKQIKFTLTSKGKEKILHDFPLLKYDSKPWDRKWRLLIFDIEETKRKNREFLRRIIRNYGFEKMQKSVYISPYPLNSDLVNIFNQNEIYKDVEIFISLENDLQKARKLANKIWNITAKNEKYQKLYVQLKKEIKNKEIKSNLPAQYLDLLISKDFLPRELLPEIWYEEEIRKILISQKQNKINEKK